MILKKHGETLPFFLNKCKKDKKLEDLIYEGIKGLQTTLKRQTHYSHEESLYKLSKPLHFYQHLIAKPMTPSDVLPHAVTHILCHKPKTGIYSSSFDVW